MSHFSFVFLFAVFLLGQDAETACVSTPNPHCYHIFCNFGQVEEVLVSLTYIEESFCKFFWDFRFNGWNNSGIEESYLEMVPASVNDIKFVTKTIRKHIGMKVFEKADKCTGDGDDVWLILG